MASRFNQYREIIDSNAAKLIAQKVKIGKVLSQLSQTNMALPTISFEARSDNLFRPKLEIIHSHKISQPLALSRV